MGWLIGVVAFFAGLVLREYLPGYLREKGKNLATKEDIAGITREIEAIRNTYATEIERVRADLRVDAHERETRFARFHDRRLEAIEGLYQRLVAVGAVFYSFLTTTHEEEGWAEHVRRASETAEEVTLFFAQHKIFFNADISDQFGEISGALNDAWATFTVDLARKVEGPIPRTESERRLAAWQRAKDIVSQTLPSLVEEIEVSMRAIVSGDEYVLDHRPVGPTKLAEELEG